MTYTIRELECFLAVAEELSFTRAAQRLHLAQPPLSRHIRTLEEKIGVTLFIRDKRHVRMTPAANVLYEETRNIPRRLVRAAEAARRCALGESARLRLGFVSAVMNHELADVFRSFREQNPDVQITLHDVAPHDQLTAIADGRLDGGFVGIQPSDPPPGIRFTPWRKEPLVCLVPSGHRLASQHSVALKDLVDESFIAVSHSSAPAFSSWLRGICDRSGFRPRIILESPRAQAVALMVAAGSGIALLPAALAELVRQSTHAIPLRPAVKITHVFASPDRKADAPLSRFIPYLK